MGKFKVGDRVRRVADGHAHGSPIGHEVTVVDGRIDTLTRVVWYEQPGGNVVWSDEKNWELVEGPVRTVTRKEIVPGEYGDILVDRTANDGSIVLLGFKTTGGIFPQCRSNFTSAELTAAIATLTTIRDALDEVA